MIKIIICGGYGATNIGNIFYELGVKYVLNKCLGENAIIISSSNKMDIHWRSVIGKDKTVFDYTETLDADYVVIMGPTLTYRYIEMWGKTFERLSGNGTKIVLMSVGANSYDDREYNELAGFLDKHKLYALLTRDRRAYQIYKDHFEHSYDGICCALYCNEYAPKYRINSEPYVVFNFDNCVEPYIIRSEKGNLIINGLNYEIKKRRFSFGNSGFDRLDGGEKIVRTIHAVTNDGYVMKNRGQNYYMSDVPYDYLNIYANADAVLTNRVHAAVTSVAYGTPVHLTNDTPRGDILRRIGCNRVYTELFKADEQMINDEKDKYEEEIRKIFV